MKAKVGDHIRIAKNIVEDPPGCRPRWISSMEYLDGTMQRVVSIKRSASDGQDYVCIAQAGPLYLSSVWYIQEEWYTVVHPCCNRRLKCS